MNTDQQEINRKKITLENAKETFGIEHPETYKAWKSYENILKEADTKKGSMQVTRNAF